MCKQCANCTGKITKDDTSILVTQDGLYLCGTCNECDLCRLPLDEDTSDFENWICESCIEED